MACCLVGNVALYASLLFGYYFLLTMAPNRPSSVTLDLPLVSGSLLVITPLAAALASHLACRANRHAHSNLRDMWLLLVALASCVAAIFWFSTLSLLPEASSHAYAAISVVLVCYAGGHCAVGAIVATHVMVRGRSGYVSRVRALEPAVTRLWVLYTAAVAITGTAALYSVTGALL